MGFYIYSMGHTGIGQTSWSHTGVGLTGMGQTGVNQMSEGLTGVGPTGTAQTGVICSCWSKLRVSGGLGEEESELPRSCPAPVPVPVPVPVPAPTVITLSMLPLPVSWLPDPLLLLWLPAATIGEGGGRG